MVLACGPEIGGPYARCVSSTHSMCALQLNARTQLLLLRVAQESILLNCGSQVRINLLRRVIERVGFFGSANSGDARESIGSNNACPAEELASVLLERISYLVLGPARSSGQNLGGTPAEEGGTQLRFGNLDQIESTRGAAILMLARAGCLEGRVTIHRDGENNKASSQDAPTPFQCVVEWDLCMPSTRLTRFIDE